MADDNDEVLIGSVNSGSFQGRSLLGAKASGGSSRSVSSCDARYRKGQVIGRGANGIVYQGLDTTTGSLCAIKEVQVYQSSDFDKLVKEVELMKKLSHANIVQYLGADLDDGSKLTIYQEWVAGGSIDSLLHKFGGSFPDEVTRRYAIDVAKGLQYLHENLVVHRDIKGGNVLITDVGVAKLADFGTSMMLAGATQTSGGQNTLCGTPYYMAPEVMKGETYGRKADIWSFGGLVQQMSTGEPPWKCLNFKSVPHLLLHVAQATSGPPLEEYDLSPDIVDLVQRCYDLDSSKRPLPRDILMHRFCARERDAPPPPPMPRTRSEDARSPPPGGPSPKNPYARKASADDPPRAPYVRKSSAGDPSPKANPYMRKSAAEDPCPPVSCFSQRSPAEDPSPRASPNPYARKSVNAVSKDPPPKATRTAAKAVARPAGAGVSDFDAFAATIADDDDDDDDDDAPALPRVLSPVKSGEPLGDDGGCDEDDGQESIQIEDAFERGLLTKAEYMLRLTRIQDDPEQEYFTISRTR